ncbi:MAG: hypothetical protein R3B84_09195 [Zavarzinella sp.]
MAQWILSPTHQCSGISRIFEFCNDDGLPAMRPYTCGHAAASTFLTYHGVVKPEEQSALQIMSAIQMHFPADTMGGYFGVSRRRMEKICRNAGLKLTVVKGISELKASLDRCEPVIVVTWVPGPVILGKMLPQGHWMVAYAYDESHIYLTNKFGGCMTWELFSKSWDHWLPGLIQMRNTGITTTAAF